MKNEVWKDYIYNYQISNLGRIRNKETNKILKLRTSGKSPYLGTVVTLGNKKKYKMLRPHRMVAEKFIPNHDGKMFVNHKDGNKHNNNVQNLEWVTQKENCVHAIKNNLNNPHGSNNGNSKLTKDNVEYIRNNCIKGNKNYGFRALAKKFNVSKTCIALIFYNKIWNENEWIK